MGQDKAEEWTEDTTLRNTGTYRVFLRGATVHCYLEGDTSQIVLHKVEKIAAHSHAGEFGGEAEVPHSVKCHCNVERYDGVLALVKDLVLSTSHVEQ